MADRRQQRDRRRTWARERRRKGDQRIFVLELASSDLHVAELQKRGDGGADEIAASVCTWRTEAASLHTPEGLAELTEALREVARQYTMYGVEIRMVLSGEFCVLRTIRGAVEEVRSELQQLEQRSRLYLSLGPGEKVLVSNTRAIDARHAQALSAVCNRATLETIQSAADAAGIEIAVIEPALSALSRAVMRLPETPSGSYLLVHVNPSGVEVGVCHEGQLLLDYRPGGQTGVADLPTLLEKHLNRLSRHVGRYLRTSPPDLNHLYLCGDEKTAEAAMRQFKRQSSLKVRYVRPQDVKATWQISDESKDDVTTAALGALLATYLPAGDADAPNLMQHIIDRKRQPIRPVLVRSAMPLAATLLLAATLGVVNVREQQSLNVMRSELDSLAVVEARATELRLQLLASKTKLTQLEKLAAQLPSDLGNALVLRLAGCMPSDVWLSRLEVTDSLTVKLHGASYLEAGVYDFVRWLEQAPGLAEVALKSTSPSSSANGPTTNFELELTLANFAKPTVAAGDPPPSQEWDQPSTVAGGDRAQGRNPRTAIRGTVDESSMLIAAGSR
jgi:hypothetical protein